MSLVVLALVSLGCSASGPASIPESAERATVTAEDSPVDVVETSVDEDSEYESRREEWHQARAARDELFAQAEEADPQERFARAQQAEAEGMSSDWAWGEVPARESVNWEQALAWWPYRPLLRADGWFPSGRAPDERLFALSEQGGRHGDPRSEECGLYVVYEYPPVTTATSRTTTQVTDAGGIFVFVMYFPPGSPLWAGHASADSRVVTVRGHSALMTERFEPEHSNRRNIRWQQEVEGGGVLLWDVFNSSTVYTAEETIMFIDRLVEVR